MGNAPSTIRKIFVGDFEDLDDATFDELIRRETFGVAPSFLRPTFKDNEDIVFGRTGQYASNVLITSKYTVWNFIPKIIFFQMKRVLNFYYMLVIAIQVTLYYVVEIPLAEILSNAVPFTIIITITLIKEAYEDRLRHKADFLVNNRTVNIVRDGVDETIKAQDLTVGTIVKVQRLEHVPADLLIIGTSDTLGRYQLSTANLDGETHLKMCFCPSGIPNIGTLEDLKEFNCLITYPAPTADLRECNGWLIALTRDLRRFAEHPDDLDEDQAVTKHTCVTCSLENMALKGTTLKNTATIYGVVIFTGKDTRFAMNSKKSRTKFSTVERSINLILIYKIFFVILLVGGCTVISLFAGTRVRNENVLEPSVDKAWYLYPITQKVNFGQVGTVGFWFGLLERIGEFLFLFNQMIPINLYIFIELQQILGSKFFSWDEEMRNPDTDEPALVNTSDISEELGQIEYLFTDKTGTLTQNKLELKHISIEGRRYDIKDDHSLWRITRGTEQYVEPSAKLDIVKFLRVLALCHDAHLVPRREQPHLAEGITELSTQMKVTTSLEDMNAFTARRGSMEEYLGDFEYESASQDEKAILETCCKLGVVLLGEHDKIITLDVNGIRESYKRHFVLDFDAARRCMSVVVEDQNGDIWLLTKGDDYTVLSKSTTGTIKSTARHTQDFVALGMRTMAVGKKQINRAGLVAFSNQLKAARQLQNDHYRLQAIQHLYKKIESNLHIVGGTGIEDQLQEHVAETLEILSEAGIKVWILTGDKVATAVQVAIACDYIKSGWKICYATEHVSEDDVKRNWNDIAIRMHKDDLPVFIVDGDNLDIGMKVCYKTVTKLILKASRVIFCRMTPLQKAKVVRMVKNTPEKPITAACGDGANDVAMLHEADIGIGIFGREGRQAARSADFAFGRFSFLRKAILVHGHWYYVRLANLTNYCFYRNMVFTLPQVHFCWDSGFSAQTLYSTFFYALYSILFTALPIFFYGYLDQPFERETLLEYPYMYKELSRNCLLNWKRNLLWLVNGLYHSAVIYWGPRTAWRYIVNPDLTNFAAFGILIFSCVLAVVHLKLFVMTRFFSGYNLLVCLFAYLVFPGLMYLVSELDLSSTEFFHSQYRGLYLTLIKKYEFWLVLAWVVFAALVPDFIIQTFASFHAIFDTAPQEEIYIEPKHYAIVRKDPEDDDRDHEYGMQPDHDDDD